MSKNKFNKRLINTVVNLVIFVFFFGVVEGIVEDKVNNMLINYDLVNSIDILSIEHKESFIGSKFFKRGIRKLVNVCYFGKK